MKKLSILIYGFIRRTLNQSKLKEKFSVDKFLPTGNINTLENSKTDKIKIRFLQSYFNPYSIISLIELFKKDEKYDVKIIVGETDNVYGVMNQTDALCVDYCSIKEYDVSKDKPDIFVIYFPIESVIVEHLKENCKLVICVAMPLVRDSGSNTNFWRWANSFVAHNPDYLLFDKLMYNDLSRTYVPKEKLILAGNPIYDVVFNANSNKVKLMLKFDKLKNKRILLWATDHGVYDGKICNDLTFDLYVKDIFDYFDKHKNIGLIFRPHPTFINEMIRYGFWNKDDIEKIKMTLNKTENIIFDDSNSMYDALVCSDALLVDSFCGVTCSAYPLHKPIGLLYRNEKIKPYHKELDESLIPIRNNKDLLGFLNKFNDNYDELCKLNFIDDDIYCYFDGNNSIRAKSIIEEKFDLIKNK